MRSKEEISCWGVRTWDEVKTIERKEEEEEGEDDDDDKDDGNKTGEFIESWSSRKRYM